MARAIVYMSEREEITECFGDVGRDWGGEGVREEKDGTESSRIACARAPISQLEIAMSSARVTGNLLASHHRVE